MDIKVTMMEEEIAEACGEWLKARDLAPARAGSFCLSQESGNPLTFRVFCHRTAQAEPHVVASGWTVESVDGFAFLSSTSTCAGKPYVVWEKHPRPSARHPAARFLSKDAAYDLALVQADCPKMVRQAFLFSDDEFVLDEPIHPGKKG